MRERIDGGIAAFGVAVAGGAIAAASPPEPTGRPLVDAVMVGLAVAVVTVAGANAPWWALVLLGAVAVAAGAAAVVVVVAGVGLALALLLAWRAIEAPAPRAVVAAIGLNALAWAQLPGFFGLTSIIAIATGLVVFVAGASKLPTSPRRAVAAATLLVGVGGIAGAAALGIAARSSQDDLEAGRDAAKEGIDALAAGDLDLAATHFADASRAFADGNAQVRSRLAGLGGFVPVAAQHRNALVELTDEGAAATGTVSAALRDIDPEALRLQDGRIDVEAIGALAGPLRRVESSLAKMRAAIATTGSPWLLDVASDELDDLDAELAARGPQLADAILAAELAPQLLGAEGARQYLVLFTTPSEARGIGGFIGNYAQLDITDGQISMSRFGRVKDLERIDQEVGTVISGPPEFLARYGEFCCRKGAEGAEGRVGDAAWRNLTVTPHFPWVGEIAVEMYRQETQVDLDGVLLIDPFVVEALLRYTGAVELPSVGETIDGDNAAEFLLRGQYELTVDANDERVDALEEAARTTFTRVLDGDLPDPVQLVQDLGPLVEQRRFLVWTTDGTVQDLLRRVGILGEMPSLDGGDGWSLALNNAGGSKIDAFLERAASYESETGADGTTAARLRLELTNTAPADGLPEYVIGNLVGLPAGTSRLYVSIYTALDVTSATIDGAPLALRRGTENGWNVYAGYVDVAAGATATIDLRLVGVVAEPGRLTTWEQPLVNPLQLAD